MLYQGNIRDYLSKQPLLFDGAMGTYLADKYIQFGGESCEKWNLRYPERIKQIHKEYIDAGAVAIKTNTFAANAGDHFTAEEVGKVIAAGTQIAREAIEESAGEQILFGDIGPVVIGDENDAAERYRLPVDCFLEQGVRHFLFETLDNIEGLDEITEYIKQKQPEAFIIVSFAVSPEGLTRSGCYGRSLYQKMMNVSSIDALGFNCISGPKHLLDLMHKLSREKNTKYISIMPNAGYPAVLDNRTYYEAHHYYYAKEMYQIAKQGASIIGGCCGTDPSFISEIAKTLQQSPLPGRKTYSADGSGRSVNSVVENRQTEQSIPVANDGQEVKNYAGKDNLRNTFAAKLACGEKVLVVELDPPVTPEIDFFMEGAAKYQQAGVDAIDIADCPVAKARIDSSILACKVMRELGLTAIPHMTCRDRNINATKALLLGLNVEGVNNVLTVTGDPVPAAERGLVKTMFSYNSAVLANHIRTLNEQIFQNNPFMISGALNVNAVNFDSQIIHAKRKISQGIDVLFTQPVLTERALNNLKRAREELDVKILGGIMPVVSYRNACFMNSEMAGIDVDPRIIEMYQDKDRAQGEELAEQISAQVAQEIAPYVDGFYLITPFKRVELILRIIKQIRGLLDR